MILCKHDNYKSFSHILSPKWSTDSVRIDVGRISKSVPHYLIQFVDESPKKKYGWFHLSYRDIVESPVMPNGSGKVYEVPLSKRNEFTPNNKCEHLIK